MGKCAADEIQLDPTDRDERRTLLAVLAINLSQVVVAGAVGVFAQSTGLLGTALDSLADATVYLVSLYAVGRTLLAKTRAAKLAGVLMMLLGLALLVEVIRRFFGGAAPIGLAMIIAAVVNGATNFVCLRLLRPHRERGVHLNATWIFTANDMLVNAGIILSGVAVMLFHSRIPDLVIGIVVVGFVLNGGWEILEQAHESEEDEQCGTGTKKSG